MGYKDREINCFACLDKDKQMRKSSQILDEDFIRNQTKIKNIKVLPIVDSTNQYLLEHIKELHSGDTCTTEYQYDGRGRHGKKWISSLGANICLSMYWNLGSGFKSIMGLSLVVGVVVVEALRVFGVTQARVKWPNDIYLKNRKLAGILVELSGKSNGVMRLIIGVGINLTMHSAHMKLMKQRWINLQEVARGVDRNLLVIQIIKTLRAALILFEKEGIKPFLPRWRRLDNFINCPVKLISGDEIVYGISRGINTNGALMLEEEDGVIKPWIGSEISLRSAERE